MDFVDLAAQQRTLRCLLFLCLLLLAYTGAQAQTVDCTDTLGTAEQDYIFGRFERALTALEGCLNQPGVPLDQRRLALRLMSVTYLADNQREPARRYAHLMLDVDPNYTPDPFADPPLFAAMLQELKAERRANPPDTPDPTPENAPLNRSPAVVHPIPGFTLTLGGPDHTLPLSGNRPPLQDPDGDALAYEVNVLTPEVLTATFAGNQLVLHPTQAGQTEVTLSAEDPSGLWAATSFTVTVVAGTPTPATPPPVTAVDTAAAAPPDTTATSPPPTQPPTDSGATRGRALLERVWTALGGQEALSRIQTLRQTGRVTLQTRKGLPEPFTVIFARPDKMRIEIGTPTGTYVQFLNGNQAGFQMPGRTPQPHSAAQMQANLWLEPMYLLARANETRAAYVGTEDVQGVACDVLELTPPGMAHLRLYVDPATWQPVQIGTAEQGTLLLGDYRTVGSVQVPFRRTSTRNGQVVAQIQFSNVQINTTLDDTLFQ